MIDSSIIYAIVTILLALTDAIRVKIAMGKVPNINHKVSWKLGIGAGASVLIWWEIFVLPGNWWSLLAAAIAALGFVGIRFALYDLCLNGFRILMGTNPTGRIDYVSPTTSSYLDEHSEKVPFWAKRIIGGMVWLLMFLAYKLIFKV